MEQLPNAIEETDVKGDTRSRLYVYLNKSCEDSHHSKKTVKEDWSLYDELVVYLFESLCQDWHGAMAVVEKLPDETKDRVMSTLDSFVEKGRREVREKAVRNLIGQSILSDELIASAVEVAVEYVADIRKEVEGEK